MRITVPDLIKSFYCCFFLFEYIEDLEGHLKNFGNVKSMTSVRERKFSR